jgi:hypothetical protein
VDDAVALVVGLVAGAVAGASSAAPAAGAASAKVIPISSRTPFRIFMVAPGLTSNESARRVRCRGILASRTTVRQFRFIRTLTWWCRF